jgi:hypothetical protein
MEINAWLGEVTPRLCAGGVRLELLSQRNTEITLLGDEDEILTFVKAIANDMGWEVSERDPGPDDLTERAIAAALAVSP